MKLHYYADTDSLYVEFQERPSVDTREIAADVRLDSSYIIRTPKVSSNYIPMSHQEVRMVPW